MEYAALQRTVRRCCAVLAIALSLYPMMLVARLDEDGITYTHPALEFGDDIALLVFVAAASYLLGSVAVQALDPGGNRDSEDK